MWPKDTSHLRRRGVEAVLRFIQQLQLLEDILVWRVLNPNFHELGNQSFVPLQEQQPKWKAFYYRNGHLVVVKTVHPAMEFLVATDGEGYVILDSFL